MKGYTQIASLLEKGIAAFLLLFGATMVMLMAGLIFVLLSQVGVLVKLSAAVALIFDSAGSLEAIFILLLKLIDLALIAVLITIIALSSYQSFVDDIDHLDNMDTEASRGIQKLGMMRPHCEALLTKSICAFPSVFRYCAPITKRSSTCTCTPYDNNKTRTKVWRYLIFPAVVGGLPTAQVTFR